MLKQPPYPPDLTLSDFCYFPRLKEYLKGQRFEGDQSVVVTAAQEFLNAQDEELFKKGISSLEKRYSKQAMQKKFNRPAAEAYPLPQYIYCRLRGLDL
ncbi:Histone-lysine N-methyltransferase SETMAR [Eumeta japonica]|uniref:Histone-lysine N-methyltransferase SETMAR n=1 Tax=Eumeta variegata TaxID=151549 RepID=A0A4C2AAI5_EUMVA|nr:Histone-lysine N-methyltransferase SETMAR [Eumeta japonica]